MKLKLGLSSLNVDALRSGTAGFVFIERQSLGRPGTKT